jgi:hypothetical protein
MSGKESKSKNHIVLIISGITAIFAIISLYNILNSQNESDDKISGISPNTSVVSNQEAKQSSKTELPTDPEVAKLASKIILLLHWQFILNSAKEFGDTSSGFLRVYLPTETITDISGQEPTTVITNGVNVLSILGPYDQDVIYFWDDVLRYISRMNSKQITDLIYVMDEEAKKKNLDGDTLTFFNEQRNKAQEILDQIKEKEPSEETKQIVLTNLQKYADDAKRHNENLSELNLIETHYPIRDKMSEYNNHLETAIDEFILYVKNGEIEHTKEIAKQVEAASKLQYEIDEMIKKDG